MQLRDYLQRHRLTQAAFGRRLSPPVSQGKVNHWINGTRRVSLAEALQIERVTGGEIRPCDLVQVGSTTEAHQAAQDQSTAVEGA
ncbi:MAG: helix-turn-helix domain-containing protein [Hydrogenophaga sp.]|uniref:helix-turn-helix domain-containing protein n=1 Tax=Hydrogenophaga sp. TaxID=1904254 RepID=UPI002AB82BDF|nr:helix-turn-helix domain-containing protein [Hydrogenophaga sp.]MDZ4282800.1 helix-turn-helix domain-containing protein [Hydrogenophaga sp.]